MVNSIYIIFKLGVVDFGNVMLWSDTFMQLKALMIFEVQKDIYISLSLIPKPHIQMTHISSGNDFKGCFPQSG